MTDSNENHKKRMAKVKAKMDEKVAQATVEKGLLLVITGNGKGKTTAGFGNVARAVGHGMKAAVVQFIKGTWDCGERDLLLSHQVPFAVMATGFTWNTQDKEADIAAAEQVWQQAKQFLRDPQYDMVLLDELTYMLSYKYLDRDEVLTAIEQRPTHQHVIVTGRSAHRMLVEMADTVSEIQSVKHAFDNGIKAQKGLDY